MNMLKEYAARQMDAAVDWLDRYAQTKDEEALHQLRVSLKKGRAVLNYFEEQQLHEKKIRKLKKQLRSIFREAGFIREAQLRIQWLKKKRYGLLLQHSSLVNNLQLYTDNFLNNAAKSKKAFQKIRKDLVELCKEVEDAAVLSYAKGLKQTVYSSLKSVTQANWHELRKSVKQLLYSGHWLQEKEKIKILTVKEHTYLDLLQEAIGNWHDADDLKTWLSDEQFFLHGDAKVKLQFNRCWEKLLKETGEKEKLVEKLLKNKKQGSTRTSNI